jgi:hypothetical protein
LRDNEVLISNTSKVFETMVFLETIFTVWLGSDEIETVKIQLVTTLKQSTTWSVVGASPPTVLIHYPATSSDERY